MAIQRRWGLALLTALCVAAGAYAAASRLGYLEPLRNRFFPRARASIRLSAGDFPAGVSAPVGDIASIPLRAARVGFIPRGSSVALLLATGGVRSSALDAKEHFFEGLLKSGYAMDAKAVVFGREEELRQALAAGAESGGVDVAALSVDRLAQWADSLRDAAPRTVLMLGRSRGQDALAGVGVERLADLRGKRLGAYFQGSAYYFALWALSRGGLSLEAGAALREGRADAVAGLTGDVELAARDRGGKVLATSADAPHLIATVLVTRGQLYVPGQT